jgi:hypothetical protein
MLKPAMYMQRKRMGGHECGMPVPGVKERERRRREAAMALRERRRRGRRPAWSISAVEMAVAMIWTTPMTMRALIAPNDGSALAKIFPP